VFFSLCYVALRWILQLAVLRVRSNEFKDLEIVAHYDGHRPHRAIGLKPPNPTRSPVAPTTEQGEIRVERLDRLGGVVHEYNLAA
jgi:hypothetical protein